jgi:hypothetical protein
LNNTFSPCPSGSFHQVDHISPEQLDVDALL